MRKLVRHPKFSLILTAFIQVYFVSVSTFFISIRLYPGVFIAAFLVSYVWSFNVKKVAFGTHADRLLYATGAAIGSICGVASGDTIRAGINLLFHSA